MKQESRIFCTPSAALVAAAAVTVNKHCSKINTNLVDDRK